MTTGELITSIIVFVLVGVFLLSGIRSFLVIGLSLVFHNGRIIQIEIPLIIGVVIYAAVSSMQINKHTKR